MVEERKCNWTSSSLNYSIWGPIVFLKKKDLNLIHSEQREEGVRHGERGGGPRAPQVLPCEGCGQHPVLEQRPQLPACVGEGRRTPFNPLS